MSSESTHNEVLISKENFDELKLPGGIEVWGANQELLEAQALKELEIFAETKEKPNKEDLEEGEIIDDDEVQENTIDIKKYFQQQQHLKERHYKSLTNEVTHVHKKIKKPRIDLTTEITGHVDDNDTEIQSDIEKDESGSEYTPSCGELNDSDYEPGLESNSTEPKSTISKPIKRKRKSDSVKITKLTDDGILEYYNSRLNNYYKTLEESSLKLSNKDDDSDDEEKNHVLKGNFKIPCNIWNKLYFYQQESVEWLWKLHQKSTGGILGDEMGLGKTVQMIAFLHALEYSRVVSCHGRFNGLGPSLIVCPATVIYQWVNHLHEWAPEFRVGILHQSGSYKGNMSKLIKEMHKSKGILITTYLGIVKYKGNLLDYNWHYLILDEGHKIRNPTTKATIAVKSIRTPHRIILTGSPMQNNLTELWSLFDFTNPGMLGDRTTFEEHFANPILQGGFSNSSPMQEATALSVATALKEIISPYLLRRSKNEVQQHICLPNKSEQVLFCSLTDDQKRLYKNYLLSEQIDAILERGKKRWFSNNFMRANVLMAITTLRKICNHPDLYVEQGAVGDAMTDSEKTSEYKRSGKMVVVAALLRIWKKQGHRVLLFSQGRSMVTIFQMFLEENGYKYLKMDGSTTISSRQPLINKFNNDFSYDVFLLTTRVGGLGINLTGANRVIIFDPDWNPATDTQARERAWRIGQEKQVTIYRLLSAGTIEEKMYQRQVWKQLLSNKVLVDPKLNKFFKSSDLHDLFSLQESTSNLETPNIFRDHRVKVQDSKSKKKSKKKVCIAPEDVFTEDKIQAMKTMAQQIAKSLTLKQVKPTSSQLELKEEREKKLDEKERLKELTAPELLQFNKEKFNAKEDTTINKIDDSKAKVSFSEALEYTGKAAVLHHTLKSGKVKDPEAVVEKAKTMREKITEPQTDHLDSFMKKAGKKAKNGKCKTILDTSGTIDGERVDYLVKTEAKKYKKPKKQVSHGSQDDFVLSKLFRKSGVADALEHEQVVQAKSSGGTLRIHSEARMRTEKSIEALRKSRLNNWRW